MTVCRHFFHNNVMAYMLVLSTEILKHGLLSYNMPEVFNKTGHRFTDIIISLDKFKPLLYREFFLGIMVHISTVC